MKGVVYIDKVQEDYVYDGYEIEGHIKFRKKIHELRMLGYRKIKQEYNEEGDLYQYYRQKGKKKIVTVTLIG